MKRKYASQVRDDAIPATGTTQRSRSIIKHQRNARAKPSPSPSTTKATAPSTVPTRRNGLPKRAIKQNAPAIAPNRSSASKSPPQTSPSHFLKKPPRPLTSTTIPSSPLITSASLRSRSSTRQRPSYANLFPPLDEYDDSSSFGESGHLNLSNSIGPFQQARLGRYHVASASTPPLAISPVRMSSRTPQDTQHTSKAAQRRRQAQDVDNSTLLQPTPPSHRCNRCVMQRRKCDGNMPKCNRCKIGDTECVYHHEPVTRSVLENLYKEGYKNTMNKQAENLRRRQSKTAGVAEEKRPPLSEVLEPVVERGWNLVSDDPAINSGALQGGDLRMLITHGRQVSQRRVSPFSPDAPRRWTYENHVDLLNALGRGSAPDVPDAAFYSVSDYIFDETTTVYKNFRMEDDSVDRLELNLRWSPPRDLRVVQDASLSEGGLTDHLRRRIGLPSLEPNMSIERHQLHEPSNQASMPC